MNQNQISIEAISRYGKHEESIKAVEELNELCVAIFQCEKLREDTPKDAHRKTIQSLIDEISDVMIVLNHLKEIYNISDRTIQNRIDFKLNRLNFRMSLRNKDEDNGLCCSVCQHCEYGYCFKIEDYTNDNYVCNSFSKGHN